MICRRTIPKVSAARKERDKVYAKVVRSWLCELWAECETIDPLCSWPLCSRLAEKQPHHIIPRSVAPSLVCEPKNFLAVCWKHHDHIHNNRAEAYRMGFLGKSTDSLDELAKRRERFAI